MSKVTYFNIQFNKYFHLISISLRVLRRGLGIIHLPQEPNNLLEVLLLK